MNLQGWSVRRYRVVEVTSLDSKLTFYSITILVGESIEPMDQLAIAMEEAGKSVLQRKPVNDVGASLIKCGDYMETLSIQLKGYAPKLQEASDAGQRMAFAAERMREAGYQLTGAIPETNKPKGKGWIKG